MSEHAPTMTLDEFFDRLPKQGWFLTPMGRIRQTPPNAAAVLIPPIVWVCPVCAVANRAIGTVRYLQNYGDAAKVIGLPLVLANSIANAADNPACKKEIRTRLIAHCGL